MGTALCVASACAEGGDGGLLDATIGMDAGPSADASTEPDAGPVIEPDAGPGDAGSIETNGRACEPCLGDTDCQPSHYCAALSVGGRACLPTCVIDLPDCPARFECVMNFTDTIPEPVCAPVGERCCVDEDGDLHGQGVGCEGLDCDDADEDTHASATEACDGLDNNCNGVVDDGDIALMCPRGTHVAQSQCEEGACGVLECEPGWGDCDADASNGCETSTDTLEACGGCGMACAPPNATGDCASGECRVSVCDAGWGDCDMNPVNGCETPLTTLFDCGFCGRTCSPAGAVGDCASGTCEIGACNPNRADCDGNAINGCETPLTTNSDCGGCGMACAPTGGVGDCSTGTCRLTICTVPGVADCDGIGSNGCETSTRTTTDCGGCGVPCARTNGTATCATGECALAGCTGGYGNCDGVEGNGCEQSLNTNAHCGGCNQPCSIAHGVGECSTGSCAVASCDPGWGDCDGIAANGCEQSLTTNTHCGACGTSCALANASESCATGSCQITSCNVGWGQCDSSHTNGCERNLRTTSNCNGCGVTCTYANSTESCSTGTCTWTGCNSGYSSCDGSTSNGCEISHRSTSGSCGGGTSTDPLSYDGDRNCGAWCPGNTGWDNFSSFTGTRDAWFRSRVYEDSDCSTDIEHRVRLEVPAGIDYDLEVFRNCSSSAVGSSRTRTLGADETVTIRESESYTSDDSFYYYVHVIWVSGATCMPYTIRFDGHNC